MKPADEKGGGAVPRWDHKENWMLEIQSFLAIII